MKDYRLKKTQQNLIFQIVSSLDLSPDQFSWIDEEIDQVVRYPRMSISEDMVVSVLIHDPSASFCKFGPTHLECSPGPTARSGQISMSFGLEVAASMWAQLLRDEVSAPDYWAEIVAGMSLLRQSSYRRTENLQFSTKEQRFISEKLDEVLRQLAQGERLEGERYDYVREEFHQLKRDSQRLGRKDWLNALIATVVSLAVSGVFAPERSSVLYRYILSSFVSLFQAVAQLQPMHPQI